MAVNLKSFDICKSVISDIYFKMKAMVSPLISEVYLIVPFYIYLLETFER